mmetsp:Transcript_16117/g.51436  ORF Transcript_16117/g.51436 Transcript_16117/m.51436 type:complete len:472 (+) Transcript_16117:513-1928(+)
MRRIQRGPWPRACASDPRSRPPILRLRSRCSEALVVAGQRLFKRVVRALAAAAHGERRGEDADGNDGRHQHRHAGLVLRSGRLGGGDVGARHEARHGARRQVEGRGGTADGRQDLRGKRLLWEHHANRPAGRRRRLDRLLCLLVRGLGLGGLGLGLLGTHGRVRVCLPLVAHARGAGLDLRRVVVRRLRVDLLASVGADGLGGLAVQPDVLGDVLLGRVVGRGAPDVDLVLPDAHVVDPEGGGPVHVVDGPGAAVPRANGGIHYQGHGLVGQLPLRSHHAARLALRLVGADLVLTKRRGRHGPDEGAVVVPRDAALGTQPPLHPVSPVLCVEIVNLGDAPGERVRAAGQALGAPGRTVPPIVGLAVGPELEPRVPGARPRRGREAEHWRPEEGRDARRELNRPDAVRTGTHIAHRALEDVELGGAAALEGEQALLVEVPVVARRDALRRVRRRKLQVRAALVVGPRPQPRV